MVTTIEDYINSNSVADPDTDPDPFHFGQPDPDPGSNKSAKIMENFHKNQPKSLEYHTFFFFKTIKLMFTDINIYSINNKTDHISEKYIFL